MAENHASCIAEESWEKIESPPLSILLVGNAQVGKSALINSLLRRRVVQEGRKQNRDVQELQGSANGYSLTVWDTPGLKDASLSENQAELVKRFSDAFSQANVVLYCIPMTSSRLSQDDVESLVLLTKSFGEEMWKKTVFALTFANEISLPPNSEETLTTYFNHRLSVWKDILQEALQLKADLSTAVTEKIPVTPVGYEDGTLPGREKWIYDLLQTCSTLDTNQEGNARVLGSFDRDTVTKTIGLAVIGGGVGALISPFGITVGVAAGIAFGAGAGCVSAAIVKKNQQNGSK